MKSLSPHSSVLPACYIQETEEDSWVMLSTATYSTGIGCIRNAAVLLALCWTEIRVSPSRVDCKIGAALRSEARSNAIQDSIHIQLQLVPRQCSMVSDTSFIYPVLLFTDTWNDSVVRHQISIVVKLSWF